jgi:mannose-6-phosphate isomerase
MAQLDAENVGLVFMKPVFVKKIWGGRKLATEFGYTIPDGNVGECWAISAHPAGDCAIEGGPFEGLHLDELWAARRDLFGNCLGDRGKFPLLIKILDTHESLSVQVHPGDVYAAEHENGSLGKKECWYIVHADPGSQIIIGQHAKNADEFRKMVEAGDWDHLLNKIPVKTGDFFAVNPGTIHALCGGCLAIETQQSSDITYRVYDYDRVQPDGTKRELHIKQACDVVDFSQVPPTSGEVTAPEVDGVTELMRCDKFVVDRIRVKEAKSVDQKWPFMCVSVYGGEGLVKVLGKEYPLKKGSHFLALSDAGTMEFSGELSMITSHLPE